jgi:hypothetical protein
MSTLKLDQVALSVALLLLRGTHGRNDMPELDRGRRATADCAADEACPLE